jgi:hypothetical protein
MELTGWAWVPLVVGFPAGLFVTLWLLARLEAWMLQPDERAAAVQRMLDQVDQVDELERAVADLMAQVAEDRRPAAQERSVEHAGSRVSSA